MKRYLELILTSSIALLFVACSNEKDDFNEINSNKDEVSDVILKERDPNLPDVVTRDIVLETRSKTRTSGVIGNSDALLGLSYNIGNSIMGDYSNVGSIVVDVEKIRALDPQFITSKFLNTNFTYSTTYTDFDRYESNSKVTDKVSSGVSLNLGLFKIGRKKETTEVFTNQVIEDSKIVYGELNIDKKNSSFQLQSSEGARKLYARECLSNIFMMNMYNSTIGSILNSYGDFVLAGYVTGGKALAFYAGKDYNASTSVAKESNMKTDINASFTWKSNSASGELGFGSDNSSSTDTNYKTANTKIQIRTYGGSSGGGQVITPTQSLDDLGLDLTSWLKSLNDVNTHTIIDVLDQGLIPISSFVLEANFRKRFDDTANGALEKRTKLINPYIEIVRVFVRTSSLGKPLYDIAAVLNTRQGDKIVLSDGRAATASEAELLANDRDVTFTQKRDAIIAKKSNYYLLEFRSNATTKLHPALRTPLCISLNEVNETTMYRYKNPNTGIEYIYDTRKRIAFSHFTSIIDGDWILDEYGIRDWVESLTVKKISMASLAAYKIIGL